MIQPADYGSRLIENRNLMLVGLVTFVLIMFCVILWIFRVYFMKARRQRRPTGPNIEYAQWDG